MNNDTPETGWLCRCDWINSLFATICANCGEARIDPSLLREQAANKLRAFANELQEYRHEDMEHDAQMWRDEQDTKASNYPY